jgi:epoxyqueuosine reductase
LEKLESILSAVKQSGQAFRESAWRIAVESWLKSRGSIKPQIKTKVSPNFSSFLAHE